MGNLHSNSKFLGCHQNEDDENGERPNIFSKTFSFLRLISIYEAVKGLYQKARSIFYRPRSTNNTSSDNIIPIQNPSTFETKPASVSEIILHTDGTQTLQSHEIVDAIAVSGKSLPDSTHSLAACTSTSAIVELSKSVGKVDKVSVVVDGVWIKHYCSRHLILLVGEGDFSFSTSLALAFGIASNMIATSLDSKTFLKKNYWSYIVELTNRGCQVMHWIDATTMAKDEYLRGYRFDRIIFNFPFAGFFKDLPRESQLRRHRRLVRLFMKNAKEMLSENGEVHITHKTNGFHLEWDLESLAVSQGLRLIEAVDFKLHHYPGYNTKRGFGGDESFNCNPSKTYKFGRAVPKLVPK